MSNNQKNRKGTGHLPAAERAKRRAERARLRALSEKMQSDPDYGTPAAKPAPSKLPGVSK